MTAVALIQAARTLVTALDAMRFSPPVAYVYNPLEYAFASYELYLRRYGDGPRRVVFVGMNPGPFGMVQTGVPFGEVAAVRDWMGIEAPVGQPRLVHPKRPVDGFACTRSEVSGKRLWGWAAERFGSAPAFFSECFVINYCPLVFLEESGRNLTPDKLRKPEREPLQQACDEHLRKALAELSPEWVIGIGVWASRRAAIALDRRVDDDALPRIATVLHPSPASPLANRGWAEAAEGQLAELGVFGARSR